MIAFMGSSMASDIETLPNQELLIENSIQIESDTPCADQWSSDVDFFQDYLGVSLKKAMRLADLAFEKCLDDVYGAD